MSIADKVEVERKFDVGETDELPVLTSIRGVKSAHGAGDQVLDAVYFDTEKLELAAHRITLRRRTGGKDAGWHLKLPISDDERAELAEPLEENPDAVPPRLAARVRVHTRHHPLIPVAHLKTRRTPVALRSADGTVLAEFSDDRVTSTTLLQPPANASWREWEVELIDGAEELLDAAETAFATLGHRPATLPSKLARALGDRYPTDIPRAPSPHRNGPASAVLLSYIQEQVQALKEHDPGVRDGAPDAVHQLRVAARRIRSVLASFRKLVEKEAPQFLREELQWLAGAVGTARDLEVMRTHLADAIDSEPPNLLNEGAKQHLDEQLGSAYEAALASGLEALDSDRYFRLLDALDGFLAAPPLTGQSKKKAQRKIARLINVEQQRLKNDVKALRTPSTANNSKTHHEVRKSAKRLRYAAEAAAPIFGKQARKLALHAEEIQTILGEDQDSVVIREKLRSLATASPQADAGTAFTYGRLHALEQQRGTTAQSRFHRKWRVSAEKRLHLQ